MVGKELFLFPFGYAMLIIDYQFRHRGKDSVPISNSSLKAR